MSFKKRKRIFCVMLVTLLLGDLISIHKLKPMAVAYQAATQVVLQAETVCALFAAAAFVAKVQIAKHWPQQAEKNIDATQPEKTHVPCAAVQSQPPANKPIQTSPVQQSAPKSYNFKNFSIEDIVTQQLQKQTGTPLAQEQKAMAHAFVTNPFEHQATSVNTLFMNLQPYNHADPLSITTGPNFIRARYGNEHHQVYGQVTLNETPHHQGPTQQELDEHRALYRYEHNPLYQKHIDNLRDQEMHTLIQAAIDNSTFGKLCALKTFFSTSLEAPFDQQIKQIRYWLAPLSFDHWSGKFSASQKSSVEALEPIVKYFKEQYGTAWRDELGKHLDMNEYHLLIDSVNYKGWEWAVNKIYSWFYSTFYLQWVNLAKKVVNNPYNQKVCALIKACEHGQFEVAKKIVNNLNDKNAQEIYDYFYLKKFDAYGIRREYANDSAWTDLSPQTKNEIKQLPNGITFYNNYLTLRAQVKKEIKAEEAQKRTCGSADLLKEHVMQQEHQHDIDHQEPTNICADKQPDKQSQNGICDAKLDEQKPPVKTCNLEVQNLPALNNDSDASGETKIDTQQHDGSTEDIDLERILDSNVDLSEEHIVEIEKLIQALAKAEKTIPQKLHNKLVEIAIEKEKELLASHANLPRTAERVFKEFETRVARLTMQYGKETVDEAVSLFRTNQKALLRNIKTLDNIEYVSKILSETKSNERWLEFLNDPAHKGKLTLNTIHETSAGIACEKQGLFKQLHRAKHPGEDFIEYIGLQKKCWDVKTAVSKTLDDISIFRAKEFISSLKHELLGNADIILNITFLSESELKELYNGLSNMLNKSELERIIIVHTENSLKSMHTQQLIRYLEK